jgi:hypothetical protein
MTARTHRTRSFNRVRPGSTWGGGGRLHQRPAMHTPHTGHAANALSLLNYKCRRRLGPRPGTRAGRPGPRTLRRPGRCAPRGSKPAPAAAAFSRLRPRRAGHRCARRRRGGSGGSSGPGSVCFAAGGGMDGGEERTGLSRREADQRAEGQRERERRRIEGGEGRAPYVRCEGGGTRAGRGGGRAGRAGSCPAR